MAIEESILHDVDKGGLAVCGVPHCSTHEGATELEAEIEWDFVCGCVRCD